MKIIFLAILLTTLPTFAGSEPDIVCSDSAGTTRFSINTSARKVIYNNTTEVEGPVFSGVYSSENFVGEILGEIEVNQVQYYVTLIMRNLNGEAQLEAIWYPRKNQYQSIKYLLNDCEIK